MSSTPQLRQKAHKTLGDVGAVKDGLLMSVTVTVRHTSRQGEETTHINHRDVDSRTQDKTVKLE